jgi:hypothetical protein
VIAPPEASSSSPVAGRTLRFHVATETGTAPYDPAESRLMGMTVAENTGTIHVRLEGFAIAVRFTDAVFDDLLSLA